MKALISPFIDAVKHLRVVLDLHTYFDPNERRLVAQSVIIGGVVWAVVMACSFRER